MGVAGAVFADDDAAGLGQGGGEQRAVVNVFGAGAGVGLDDRSIGVGGQGEAPELVAAGHGEVQNAVVVGQIPGAVQGDLGAGAGGAAVVSLGASAGYGGYSAGGQVDAADGVVFGVGDIEGVAVHQFHTLGVVEGGGGVAAVRGNPRRRCR